MRLPLLVILFVPLLRRTHAVIRVGGLFNLTSENDVDIQRDALEYALQEATERLKELDFRFEPEISVYLTDRDAFDGGKKVCDLMQNGIAAIFGPQSGITHYTVQAICDSKEIPHVLTRWELDQREGACSLNMYPYPKVLSRVFADIVNAWEWRKYLILYEDGESLLRMKDLIKAQFGEKTDVHLRKLVEDDRKSYRGLLRNITATGIKNIVLDCSIQLLPDILKQAQQVGLMGASYKFIVTNLDFHTLDLEPYKYGGTNITAVRLFNPEDAYVAETVGNLVEFIKKKRYLDNFEMINLPLDAALIIDAVNLYANATVAILDSEEKREIPPVPCSSSFTWQHGYSIINQMKRSTLNGLTGRVEFDNLGFRSDFNVHILELEEDGLKEVGKWTPSEIYIQRRDEAPTIPRRGSYCNLRNLTLNVVFPLTPPYGMLVKSHKSLKGNDRFEGFCIDLIQELSSMSHNFSVNFITTPKTKTSGAPQKLSDKTTKWDGMVGFILDGKADLACGDLTITKEREEVVDFTSVFMNLGIAILYKKPQSESPGFFSFLSPFKPTVWILVVTAYVSVSLLFFVMGRISPYEWTNPFPCVQEPDELENQFTLTNSFWFTVGALMQQGSEIAPIAVSTRVAAGIWWFFTLIMVACYTANLAAFLTTENPNEEFTNIEELAQQSEIKYGAKKDGATIKFFNESSVMLHKQMFKYMMNNFDDVVMGSSPDGVKRAAREKFAFLMESSQIEYEVERECSLTQIGKPIDDKGHGIAMKKGSCYLGLFSQNILKLQETGRLSDLKRKWWKEKYTGTCQTKDKNEAEKLGLTNVGGVFLVLGIGAGVAFFIAVLEQFIYVWNLSRDEQISVKEHLKRELRFFLLCRGTTKPVSFENGSDRSDGALTNE